jgi:hypothetical protein
MGRLGGLPQVTVVAVSVGRRIHFACVVVGPGHR